MADFDPNDLDLILMCTSTPEDIFGAAPQVQGNWLIFIAESNKEALIKIAIFMTYNPSCMQVSKNLGLDGSTHFKQDCFQIY